MKSYVIASLLAASLMFAGTVTLVGAASAADAEPARAEREERGPFGRLTDEQRARLRPMLQEHRRATESARDSLWVKERTLQALERNPNATVKDITALAKEVGDLRSQLRARHQAFGEKVSQELGIELPYEMAGMCPGSGFGHRGDGHRGFGHGKGPRHGHEGGGYHGRGPR